MVGQLRRILERLQLDVELVARRCLPEAFFGGQVSDETKETTKSDLAKGMASLDRIFVGDPYAAGAELSLADFYTFFCFGLAGGIVQKIFGDDLLADYPKIQGVIALMAEHPSVAQVTAEQAS